MSVTLTDNEGNSIDVNAWNWGVMHYTLVCCRPPLLEDEQLLEQLRFGGVELKEQEVAEIGSYLQELVLPRIKPGERMLFDLTVTNEPDKGTFFRDNLEKNYSLHHDVLVKVIAFLKTAVAPVKVM